MLMRLSVVEDSDDSDCDICYCGVGGWVGGEDGCIDVENSYYRYHLLVRHHYLYLVPAGGGPVEWGLGFPLFGGGGL